MHPLFSVLIILPVMIVQYEIYGWSMFFWWKACSSNGCRLKSVTIWFKLLDLWRYETLFIQGIQGASLLRGESFSCRLLPIFGNFQQITTCLFEKFMCFMKPEIRKQKEGSCWWTNACQRQGVNRVDSLRNVPECLVSWQLSRCFPGIAQIVCFWET